MTATYMTLKIQAGDFEQGFSEVILEVQSNKKPNTSNQKIILSLPPSPNLQQLYRQWQEQYIFLINDGRGDFKTEQVTHFSLAECENSSQKLRTQFNDWLQPLQKALNLALNSQEQVYFWIHAHKDLKDSTKKLLYQLPWHSWNLFPENCPVEIILSLNENAPTRPPKKVQGSKNIPKVRILGFLGSSKGIDLDSDKKEICKLPGAKPDFFKEPERKQFDQLWTKSWDILFYGGHSKTIEDGQTGLL